MASTLYHRDRMDTDTLLFKIDSVRRIDGVIDFFGELPPSADAPWPGAGEDERADSPNSSRSREGFGTTRTTSS